MYVCGNEQTMIQANELRIGNLLNYDTAEGDVVIATIDWQDLQWATEDPKGFNLVHSPIPLTEEWLVKFGFFEIKPLVLIKRGLLFRDNIKNPCSELTLEVGNGFRVTVQYLHQLQNLYFAITGEELEIK